jgi:site-specific DNA recombinase
MKDLNPLNQFAKGSPLKATKAKTAVAYTRVSTKEQADNNQSLHTQIKHIKAYGQKQSLQIIAEFGGTYESAKSDERKEFKRMLAFAKKKKVDMILVYSIDRFSRSGPNAVYISEQLRKSGIGIMSVTQPIDAMTASGELQQSIYFMFSQYENQQRKEKCMAGTKEKLLQGEWVTKPPLGYEISRENGKREIVINQKGRLLRQALLKKMRYDTPFVELAKWLNKRGVKVTSKRLSDLARNVFYCGFLSHNALEGQIVKGNHPLLITKSEFLRLNKLLNSKGKSNDREVIALPLKGHLICSGCNAKMTGYQVKAKGLWYYKCNTQGCRHNSSAKLMHNKWEESLETLQIGKIFEAPLAQQMKRTLDCLRTSETKDQGILNKRNTELLKKIEQLEERYALGEIGYELFDKYQVKYQAEQAPIVEEIQKFENPVSNHENLSKSSAKAICNLLSIWEELDYERQQDFIQAVFPKGIVVDKKKQDYRTENLNSAIVYLSSIMSDDGTIKEPSNKDIPSYSSLVEGGRIEPNKNP